MLPSLMFEFMGMTSFAPTCFLDLMDDDVESDGSSISDMAPSHRLYWECAMADTPGQPPAVTESLQTHAPPSPHAETPSSHVSMRRNYDNSGRISQRLRQRARCTTLRPMRIN